MLHRALRTIREIHRFQQAEMAERLGIARSHLSEIESGKKVASIDLLSRYANVFNVPPSTFLSFAEALEGSSPERQANAKKLMSVLEWVMEKDDGRSERQRLQA